MSDAFDWRKDAADSYSLAMRAQRRNLLDQQGRDYHVTVDALFGNSKCRFQTKLTGTRAEAMAYADRDWPAALTFVTDRLTHEIWHRAPGGEWVEGEGDIDG